MKTRFCKECEGRTPWNKAENRKDSPYICEGCNSIVNINHLTLYSK